MNQPTSFFTPNPSGMPEPGLYIVATPIGNLRDMTLRAVDILTAADVIACEDTRVTAKLKSAYGLKAPLCSYHDHNEEKATRHLLNVLSDGDKIVALVSDAGTPLMSDPGYRLARACIDAGYPVYSIPGACASVTALTLSGLPVSRFLFSGFLPAKSTARKKELETLAEIPATLVFYESAKRVTACMKDMLAVLGDREAALARELTKRFEEVLRAPLSELIAHCEKDGIKGEITLVIAPADQNAAKDALTQDDIDALLIAALDGGKESIKTASAAIADKTGLKKRILYNRLLELQKQ
ncbi:MAG: 16S rRNA (cytidine(1402)-2'-O)-methyltransferase [Alphaproteobacteria bacterium]|nr:MAG: 16S rRNA (cytidine(1402)-2'-O)-methyltransferase [Alphaproteobacteria bacterium]